jgi:hypothetical protein
MTECNFTIDQLNARVDAWLQSPRRKAARCFAATFEAGTHDDPVCKCGRVIRKHVSTVHQTANPRDAERTTPRSEAEKSVDGIADALRQHRALAQRFTEEQLASLASAASVARDGDATSACSAAHGAIQFELDTATSTHVTVCPKGGLVLRNDMKLRTHHGKKWKTVTVRSSGTPTAAWDAAVALDADEKFLALDGGNDIGSARAAHAEALRLADAQRAEQAIQLSRRRQAASLSADAAKVAADAAKAAAARAQATEPRPQAAGTGVHLPLWAPMARLADDPVDFDDIDVIGLPGSHVVSPVDFDDIMDWTPSVAAR